MGLGPLVPVRGILLRRHGNYVLVEVDFGDGKLVEVIREFDGNFSHHVSEHGLASLRDKHSTSAA